MKLLYVCADRADDPLLWSGIVANCRQALLASGVELAVLDQIPFECPLPLRFYHQLHKRFGRKVHMVQIEPAVLQRAAARIAKRFSEGDCDAVFSLGTGVPVYAYLPSEIPVISYLDATKRTWIANYFGLETLCARSLRHVDEVDRVSLHTNMLTVFSSDWARDEAVRDYNVPIERTAVVPIGANLKAAPSHLEVAGWIDARGQNELRLLFLGKEWLRKGGADALALVRALRARGLPATLDIIGCSPELDEADRKFARVHGFVDHSTPEGRETFHVILRETYMLLFLSHAEAYGIALCEAAAFGVPAFASRVGGIPTIVQHEVTGWLNDLPFAAETAAEIIAGVWRSPDVYRRVARAARTDYATRLNWGATADGLQANIRRVLAQRAAGAVK